MKQSAVITRFNRLAATGKCCLLLLFLAFIAGCAGKPVEQPLSLFNLYGQMTIHQPQQASRRFLFTWRRQQVVDGFRDEAEIKTPFGSTQARLLFTPQQATVEYQNKTITAENAAQLIERVLGYPLPLQAFAYWVRGESAPNAETDEEKNSDGQIIRIKQYNWNINYLEYYPDGNPKKMALRDSNGGEVQLHIRDWLSI